MEYSKTKNIDDIKIKKLIENYNINKDNLYTLTEMLSEVIYSFPFITSNMDSDNCSEFYEYILVRMDKIISSYKIMDCKFLTWFTVVLKRHFYNWLKHKEVKDNREITVLNAPIKSESNTEMISLIPDLSDDNYEFNNEQSDVLRAINSLPIREKIILKLHYFDFFTDSDLNETSQIFECNLDSLIKRYITIRSRVAKRNELLKELQDRVVKAYNKKAVYLDKKINNLNQQKIKIFETKIKKFEKDHKNNLCKLEKTYSSVRNRDISYLLGISTKIVANSLFRGKRLLKKILEKELKVG